MRNNYELVAEILFVVFSALAAWWSKRTNAQLKPNETRATRAAHSPQNNLNGNEVNVGDLITGLLEETNRIHERLDHLEDPR